MTTSYQDKYTIIIPTHNRSDYLARSFRYYAEVGVTSRIIVADSSVPEIQAANRAQCQAYRSALNLSYHPFANILIPKLHKAAELVTTPYTVYCADDDMLMPEGIQQCVDFLEKNTGYSCTEGDTYYFDIRSGSQPRLYLVPTFGVEEQHVVQRVQKIARRDYATFYATFPTPVLQHLMRLAATHTSYEEARMFPELLLHTLSAVKGRVKHLHVPYYLKEQHAGNAGTLVPAVREGEDWGPHYDRCRQVIVSEIMLEQQTTRLQAEQLWDEIWSRLRPRSLRPQRSAMAEAVSRFALNVRRNFNFLSDLFRKTPAHRRRRVSLQHRQLQTKAWKTAWGLMAEYHAPKPGDATRKIA